MKKRMNKGIALMLALCMLIAMVPVISAETPVTVSMFSSNFTTSGLNFGGNGSISDTSGYTITWNDDSAVFVREESSLGYFRQVYGLVDGKKPLVALPAGHYTTAKFTFKTEIPADGYYAISLTPILSQIGGTYGVYVNDEFAGSVNTWNGIEGTSGWNSSTTAGAEVQLHTLYLEADVDGYVKVTLKNLSTVLDTTIADSYKDAYTVPLGFQEFKLTPVAAPPEYEGISQDITAGIFCKGETKDFLIQAKMDDGSFKVFDTSDTSVNNMTASVPAGSSVELSNLELKADGLYGKIKAVRGDEASTITIIATIDGEEHTETIEITPLAELVPMATKIVAHDTTMDTEKLPASGQYPIDFETHDLVWLDGKAEGVEEKTNIAYYRQVGLAQYDGYGNYYRWPLGVLSENSNPQFTIRAKLASGTYAISLTPIMSQLGCTYGVWVGGQYAGTINSWNGIEGVDGWSSGASAGTTAVLNTLSLTADENNWVEITLKNLSDISEVQNPERVSIGFANITLTPTADPTVAPAYASIEENITSVDFHEGDILDFAISAKMNDGSIRRFDTSNTEENNMTYEVTGDSVELTDVSLTSDGLTGRITAVRGEETSVITVTTTIGGEAHIETIEVTPLPKRVAVVTTVSMSDKIVTSSFSTSNPSAWTGFEDSIQLLDETNIGRTNWINNYRLPSASVREGKKVFAFKVRLVPGPYAINVTPVMSGRGTSFNVIVDGQFAGRVDTRNKDLGNNVYEPAEKKQQLNSLNLTGTDGWVTVRLEVVSTVSELADGYNDTIGLGDITFTPLGETVSSTGLNENLTNTKTFVGKSHDFVISPVLTDGSTRVFAENDADNKIEASVDGSSVELSGMVMKADGLHGKIKGLSAEEATINVAVTIGGITNNYTIKVTPIQVYTYSMLAERLTTSGINYDGDGAITDANGYTIAWDNDNAVFVREESNLGYFRQVSGLVDGETPAFAFPAGNYSNAQFTFKAKIPANGRYAVSIVPILSQLGGKYGVWVNDQFAGSVNSWNGIEGCENWTETTTAGDEVKLNTLNLSADADGYVKIRIKNLSTVSGTTSADSYKDANYTPVAFQEITLTPTDVDPAFDSISENITEGNFIVGETRDFVIKAKMDDGSYKYFNTADTSKNNITATFVEGSSIRLSDLVLKDDGLHGKITALRGDDKAIVTVIAKIDGVEHTEKIWVTLLKEPAPEAIKIVPHDTTMDVTQLPPSGTYAISSTHNLVWTSVVAEWVREKSNIANFRQVDLKKYDGFGQYYRWPLGILSDTSNPQLTLRAKVSSGTYSVSFTPIMSYRGGTVGVWVDGQYAGSVNTWNGATTSTDWHSTAAAGETAELNTLNLTSDEDGWVEITIKNLSDASQVQDPVLVSIGFANIKLTPAENSTDAPEYTGLSENIFAAPVYGGYATDFVISAKMNDGKLRRFDPTDPENFIAASVAGGSSVELSDMVMKEDGLHGKITGVRNGEEATITVNVTIDGEEHIEEISVTPIEMPAFASTEIQIQPLLLVGDEIMLNAVAKYSDGSVAPASAVENVFSSESDKVEIIGNKLITKSEGNARIKVTTTLKGTEQTVDGFIDVAIIAEGIKTVKLSAGGSRYIRLTAKENDTVPMYVTAETNLGNEVDITGAEVAFEALNPEVADVTPDGTIIPKAVGDASFKVRLVYDGKTYELSDTLQVIWGKDSSALITEEMRENSEENIKTYDWAKNSVRNLLSNADKYVDRLDELYEMFPSEGIPRSFQIGYPGDPYGYTCQYCNTNLMAEYSQFPWIARPLDLKWKVRCPECSRMFPSNDFGSFYKLGLNDYGEFDRMRALERHREKFLGKILELYPDVTEPGDDHSETWYQYYGYGIPGGYLTNDLYPEVGTANATAFKGRFDPEIEKTERWSVDDGYGYFSGRIWDEMNQLEEHYSYIAVYIHEGLFRASWGGAGTLQLVLSDLSQAYSYTGDPKYGRPAAILLDRLADLYPGFDFAQWGSAYDTSHGGTLQGKIIGSIWGNNASAYAKAYDYLYDMYDDPYVLEYIQEKGKTLKFRHAKETPSQIRTNIEDGIIREIFEAIKTRRICGNFGYPQSALATTAAAMNALPDTQEMIDYLMAPGFSEHPVAGQHVNEMDGLGYHTEILTTVDYDGLGEEASHYNYGHFTSIYSVQKTLEKITIYDGADLFNTFPRFKKMAYAFFPLTMSDYTANMGDSGQTIKNSLWMDSDIAIQLYRRLGDIRFAQYAYMANGNSAKGLHEDIYTKNPEAIQKELEALIDEHGELTIPSELLGGYGFATLKDGLVYRDVSDGTKLDNRRGVWMYWGNNVIHGHQDSLGINIDAFGLDMTPDLGYPVSTAYTSDNRHWDRVTLSHNTVQVDDDTQEFTRSKGKAMHYDDSDIVKLMDVDAKDAYTQTDAYRRSVIMVNIDDDNSYYVDFFRIKGGNSHEYSFHAQSDTIAETSDLDLVDMSEYGSYANVWNIEKTGQPVEEEYLRNGVGDDPYTDINNGARYKTKYPMSYTWLENVQRDASQTDKFEVDFKVTDFGKKLEDGSGLHMRATMLGMDDGIDSKVAIADGYAPQKAANQAVPKLKYLLVKREGENLDTLFSTVYEPYRHERTLENIEEMPLTIKSGAEGADNVARAVKVTHAGGNRIDYVFYATNNDVIYTLNDNGFELDFRGFAGVYSIGKDKEGNFQNTYRYVNDGDIIGEATGKAAIEGQIADFTTEHAFENEITMLMTDPISAEEAKDLAGKYLFVDNDGKLNASYKILGAEVAGDKLKLDLGDVSLIRTLVNELDLDGGYVYNISKWDNCRIPLSYEENYAPEFDPVQNGATSVGSMYTQKLSAHNPPDSPTPDAQIEIIGRDLPRGATYDSATGSFSWKPSTTQIGDHRISFTARDELGRETTVHFIVTVYGSTTGGSSSSNSGSSGGGGGGGGGAILPEEPDEPIVDPDEPVVDPDEPTDGEDVGDDVLDVPSDEGFADLGNHAWAEESINSLADEGIIKGTSDTTYSPAANITRADFAILLVRAFKLESENEENFADVEASDYFAAELATARNTGIVGGIGDNKYAPRRTITRQDMMVIVYRALKTLGIELEGGEVEYSDFDKIPEYAKEAVSALIANGLINGKNGLIDGAANTTRAEVAVLIKRILDFVASK